MGDLLSSSSANAASKVACEDVRAAFQRGDLPEGPEIDAHLECCPICQELLADGAQLGRALGPVEEVDVAAAGALYQQLTLDLGRERSALGWLRSRPTATRLALGFGLVAVLVGLNATLMARADLAVYPIPRLLAVAVAYAALLVLALPLALRGLQLKPSKVPLGWVIGLAVLAPLALSALPQAHIEHTASLAGVGDDFAKRAIKCFFFGLALAAPLVATLAALDRTAQRSRGGVLLAAAAAGITGVLGLHLHCPITDPTHIVVGHGTVALALIAVYWGVLHYVLRRV